MNALILAFSIGTFLIVAVGAVFLLKRHHRTEQAIDAAREQLYTVGNNNDLVHEDMKDEIVTMSGRLQFLTARSIAEELAAEKKAHESHKPEDTP
jgi:hypothetical protein